MIRKIVTIGPESTGKSTLCAHLAGRYQTLWVPEYAREHLLREGMNYTYDDLLFIARKQLLLEDEITKNSTAELLFVDTDMYVMKIWCEFVFGKCHQWILDKIVERQYDLYFLCNTDLAWVKDELREYPDLESRQVLFHMYRDLMINQQVPWKIISGNEKERLGAAVGAVNTLLQ